MSECVHYIQLKILHTCDDSLRAKGRSYIRFKLHLQKVQTSILTACVIRTALVVSFPIDAILFAYIEYPERVF